MKNRLIEINFPRINKTLLFLTRVNNNRIKWAIYRATEQLANAGDNNIFAYESFFMRYIQEKEGYGSIESLQPETCFYTDSRVSEDLDNGVLDLLMVDNPVEDDERERIICIHHDEVNAYYKTAASKEMIGIIIYNAKEKLKDTSSKAEMFENISKEFEIETSSTIVLPISETFYNYAESIPDEPEGELFKYSEEGIADNLKNLAQCESVKKNPCNGDEFLQDSCLDLALDLGRKRKHQQGVDSGVLIKVSEVLNAIDIFLIANGLNHTDLLKYRGDNTITKIVEESIQSDQY